MKKTIGTITSLLAAASLLIASPVLANTIVVSPAQPNSWDFQLVGAATGATGQFVTNSDYGIPLLPTFGNGSVRLFTGADGTNQVQMRNNSFDGKRLDSLTALSYYTYVASNTSLVGGIQVPYVVLEVNDNKVPAKTYSMMFVPGVDVNSNLPTPSVWQQWNARTGTWAIIGSSSTWNTIDEFLSDNPNATIVNFTPLGGVGFVTPTGDHSPDVFDGNVDGFRIDIGGTSTTYDFENNTNASTTPTSKDDCKKGGWQNFTNPVFKNQGSCVSFVEANANAGK